MSERVFVSFNNGVPLRDCLFGLLHNSSCLPTDSLRFFGLGDLLTALALFIAVYQLRNFRWDIGFEVHKLLKWAIYVLVILSIFLVIIAQLIPETPFLLYWAQLPSLLQFSGFLSMLIAIGLYWIIGNTNQLFTAKNAQKYFSALYQKLAEGDPRQIEGIVQILNRDLETIFSVLNDKKTPLASKEAILRIFYFLLPDRQIINFLASKRLDVLFKVLEGMTLGHHFEFDKFVKRIVEQMLDDQDSHLYRLLDGEGIHHGYQLYSLLFEQDYFHSNFRVLNLIFRYDNYPKNTSQLLVQLEILKLSFKGTLTGKVDFISIQSSFWEMTGISAYAQKLCCELNRDNDYETKERIKTALQSLVMFFGMSFQSLYDECVRNETLIEFEKTSVLDITKIKSHGRYNPQNLTAQHILLILNFWDAISNINPENEYVRFLALHSAEGIVLDFGHGISSSEDVFLTDLLRRVKQNVEHGFYPATTRVALVIFGQIGLGEKTEIRTNFLKYLYSDLVPRLLRKETMANGKETMEEALITSYFSRFNHETKKIEHRTGSDEWVEINP